MPDPHELQTPSQWVVRWGALVCPGGAVLDVASGRGRHARHLAAQGYRVTAVDRDAAALAAVAGLAGVLTFEADLEGAPWPFTAGAFDGVVVANYLHRPLFDALAASLAPGGLLIYETFMQGNERYGKPSNPDFLLRPYELADAWRGRLEVVAFEQGRVERPKAAVVQRVCALRPPADVTIA
ncbi:MAG: class I SAM-dependent methyltransferase [Burkholderiales bacterium]